MGASARIVSCSGCPKITVRTLEAEPDVASRVEGGDYVIQASGIKHEISRFPRKEHPHMPGSSTALGRVSFRGNVPVHIAFRQQYGAGIQDDADFAALWLAHAVTCRRGCHGDQ